MKNALLDRSCFPGSKFEHQWTLRYHRHEAERLRQLKAKRALQARYVRKTST